MRSAWKFDSEVQVWQISKIETQSRAKVSRSGFGPWVLTITTAQATWSDIFSFADLSSVLMKLLKMHHLSLTAILAKL